jgi:hypothetical protein
MDTSDEAMRNTAAELAKALLFGCRAESDGKMIGHVYLGREQPESF